MTPLDGPIVLKLLLVMFLSLMSALVPSAPERDTRDSGYGLFVFATASHPTVTDGSSSGGNPIFFWRGLEPEEGEYDWDQLDKAVVQALTTGTRIIPRIVTNFSIFGETSPDWFFDAKGAQYYYPHDEAENLDYRAPIPWDPVYEDKFGAFLEALGERYNGNPAIEFFQITSAGVYGELYLGSNRPDGFTVQVYKASIEHWTDAWRDAFPNTNLSIMINGLGDNVGEEAASHAVERGYYLQMNSPIGHPATRALLAEYADVTKIIIEAENGGCQTATGVGFQEMVHSLFGFGYHVDYVTLCPQSFIPGSTGEELERVWERLPRAPGSGSNSD